MTKLDRLLSLRARLEAEIEAEVDRLYREALAARRLAQRAEHKRAKCGTDSGYYRHRRTLHEPACDACKQAHTVVTTLRGWEHRREEI